MRDEFRSWLQKNAAQEAEKAREALREAAFAQDPETRKLAQDRAIAHEARAETLDKVSSAHLHQEFHLDLNGKVFPEHVGDLLDW